LHRENILHRDIKLQNIYMDEQAKIKIGGFGNALKLIPGAKPPK
jgi:serine/threonine protein kinase